MKNSDEIQEQAAAAEEELTLDEQIERAMVARNMSLRLPTERKIRRRQTSNYLERHSGHRGLNRNRLRGPAEPRSFFG